MARRRGKANNGAVLGFEETLWATADQLRGHMEPAEYKHVVLGSVFPRYISHAFTEHHTNLVRWSADVPRTGIA